MLKSDKGHSTYNRRKEAVEQSFAHSKILHGLRYCRFRGLKAEGLATIHGGIFNSFPYTTFNQNLGLLALSKVPSRFVVIASGIIFVALGLIPKFAALATIIPQPVIGGATTIMFAMVSVAGINMLKAVDL